MLTRDPDSLCDVFTLSIREIDLWSAVLRRIWKIAVALTLGVHGRGSVVSASAITVGLGRSQAASSHQMQSEPLTELLGRLSIR